MCRDLACQQACQLLMLFLSLLGYDGINLDMSLIRYGIAGNISADKLLLKQDRTNNTTPYHHPPPPPSALSTDISAPLAEYCFPKKV